MYDERITPNEVLIVRDGATFLAPVLSVTAHPPGLHPDDCPLVSDCTAVELVTAHGSRWWGFERAWIDSDLRMHVAGFDARNETVREWEKVT